MASATPPPADRDLLARLRAAPPSETRRLLLRFVCELTAEFLALDDDEEMGPDDGFLEFGFDSLMAVDFKILLEARLRCALRSTALFDCPTPADLADYLAEALGLETPGRPAARRDADDGTPEEPAVDVSALPVEELRALAGRQAARLRSLEEAMREPIAIVGMACRFPGHCNDPESFWELQREGRDAVVEIPRSRWDIDAFFDPDRDAAGKMYVRHGGFIDDVDLFDARFFGISPREATELDPNQRLVLEVCYEAVEDAGISPDDLAGTPVGVFVGTRGPEYLIGQTDVLPETIQTYYATGNALSTLAGRVSYALGFTGPSFALDTACSSSLVALHCAVQSLRRGECSAALVGGINTLLDPLATISVCKASMLSEDGRCKTFDASANGYVRSEGVGVVMLKRLSRAEADGDRILALVRGTAVNQDGASGGLTVPSGPMQEAVVRLALANGGVKPHDVDYVEAHGTGTSLGDPIEVGALDAVFGPGRPADRPLHAGSVKTNIGHLETAAGMAGLFKSVLAMRHGLIPRHLHLETPNPHIPWDRTVLRVPLENTPWPAGDRPRFAGVSSFGFSGTNAHAVLQEAPAPRTRGEAVRPVDTLLLSAATQPALDELVGAWRDHAAHVAGGEADVDGASPTLTDLCAGAATGRARHPFRRAFVASDVDQLRLQLDAGARGEPVGLAGRAPAHAPKVGFLFTGQGSQHAEMGRGLHAAEPVFRDTLDRCAALLEPHLTVPLLELLWGEHRDLLSRTDCTQPAIFAVEVALANLLASWGVEPAWVAGHSVGEYAAAHVAGVLSLEDACALIAARGRLMVERTEPGAMLAAVTTVDAVRPLVDEARDALAVAAVNGEESVVLSGTHEAVAAARGRLEERGVRCTPLDVSHAFHSPLMEPMLDAFEEVASGVTFGRPQVGFTSCLDPGPADSSIARADYWVRHVRDPVRFLDGMRALELERCDVLVEVGPSPVLTGMAKRFVRRPELAWLTTLRPGRDEPRELQTLLGELFVRGAPIDGHGVHRGFRRRRVPLPGTPFQRERYWLPPKKAGAAGARVVDPSAHPLLGAPVQVATLEPGHRLFESRLDVGSPAWVADHRAFDQPLVPAAAFLEWALAAGNRLLGTPHLRLDDVAVPAPLPLDEEPRTVQLHLAPEDGGGFRFRLLSRPDDAETWTVHATGRLAADATEPPTHDLDALEARCPEALEPAEFYAGYDAIGLGYGPRFAAITELRRGEGELVARLHRPDGVPTLPGGVLHPVLLDACFQTTRALSLQHGVDTMYLPTAMERVSVTGTATDAGRCRTTMRPLSADAATAADGSPRLLVMDVELLDEGGRVLARVEGLQLVRADRAALLAGDDPFRALAHVVSWEPAEAGRVPATAHGTWLVLEDDGPTGAAIAQALETRGAHAVRVAGSDRPADDAGWDALLARQPDDLRGVLHAAGLPSLRARAGERPAGSAPGTADTAPADPARLHALCGTALSVVKALAPRGAAAPRLVLLTRGAVPAGPDGAVTDADGGTLHGLGATLELEHPELRPLLADLDPSADPAEVAALVDELLLDGPESRVAWRDGVRRVARLRRRPARPPGLRVPDAPAFTLRARRYGVLENLELLPRERVAPGPGELEIEVAAASLNFKDVLFALGLLAEFTGVTEAPDQPLGLECCGVVTRVGEGVTGFAPGDEVVTAVLGSMASHVVAPVHGVIRKPAALTPAQAASLPTIFLTALYALERRAAIGPGDTVLVHAAAGGVGQAALQVAKRAGARVFATASPGKWSVLEAQGVERVMNSRATDFADEVLAATDGRGVDVVLNSLAGDAIPASLRCLAQGGRFVDIGKIGVWTPEQVAAERPDATYATFDMADVLEADPDLHASLLDDLSRAFDDGGLSAPPVRCWPLTRAVSAFTHLAQARNVGKVVLSVPRPAGATLRDDRSWLVTGGLGALGLGAARRLVERGARHLVLCGRSAPGEEAAAAVAELEAAGAHVRVAALDVADRAAVHALLDEVRPPLAGIVHAAGVLDDGMLANQEWSRFERVFAPKVTGAANLHAWSATRCLDAFLLYSSQAALVGNAGQGNYSAANGFLDALAHARRTRGLPAASIDWGPWSGGGMAAEIEARAEARLFEMGVRTIPPEQGLAVLERVLDEADAPQVGVLPVTWSRFLARHRGDVPPFYSGLVSGAADGASRDDGDFLARLAAAGPDEAHALLTTYVAGQLAGVMGFASADDVDVHQDFADMGIDSLLAVDLRNRLEASLGLTLPATLVFDHPDLASLIDHVAEQLAAGGSPDGGAAPDADPTAAEPASLADAEAALLAEIEALPEEEVERLLAAEDEREEDAAP